MAADVKQHALLYLSRVNATVVYVFAYPEDYLEGTLTGFIGPGSLCVDKSGDIFVPDAVGDIVEYAHGDAAPIATLQDESGSTPLDCSVDPTTGQLAVTNYNTGDVALYHRGSTPNQRNNGWIGPKLVSDPVITLTNQCSYDNEGNLFMDGLNGNLQYSFAELPHGSEAFVNLSLPKRIGYFGAMRWDGEYLALAGRAGIYQLAVSPSGVRIAGLTKLSGSSGVAQFTFPSVDEGKLGQATQVVVPDQTGNNVKVWRYPAGGNATRTLVNNIIAPLGSAVSASRK